MLLGGSARDFLDGEAGQDTLTGGEDDDFIEGGDGDDLLDGGAGQETLVGEGGNDLLRGGPDQDTMSGGEGNDRLEGNGDNDTVNGDGGTDTLFGYAGDDAVAGGDGADLVRGGDGDDTVYGGSLVSDGGGGFPLEADGADDSLFGGVGEDGFFYLSGDGNDVINDFGPGRDIIFFAGTGLTFESFDTAPAPDGDGVLTNADDYVSVRGGVTVLDIGAAQSAGAITGVDTLEVRTDGLTSADFIFA